MIAVFQITASPSAQSRQLWRRTGNFLKTFLQFHVYDLRFNAAGLTTLLIEFWTLMIVATVCSILVLRNDRNYKYTFMFPKIDSTQWLTEYFIVFFPGQRGCYTDSEGAATWWCKMEVATVSSGRIHNKWVFTIIKVVSGKLNFFLSETNIRSGIHSSTKTRFFKRNYHLFAINIL